MYPKAKVFGITTSHAVMKINTELGYSPVPFSELTNDDAFGKDAQAVLIMMYSQEQTVKCAYVQECYMIH